MVLAVPGLTPAAYWALAPAEAIALADELNRQAKEQQRRSKRR